VLHPKSHTVTLNTEIETYFVTIKGAMCKNIEYLLTEMQYDNHNYVFSGV